MGAGDSFRVNGLLRRACPSLICTDCNIRVVKWDGFKWDYNITDYLFFRAGFGDFEKLSKGLVSSPSSVAYSCACKGYYVSLGEPVPNGYNWKCTGCDF